MKSERKQASLLCKRIMVAESMERSALSVFENADQMLKEAADTNKSAVVELDALINKLGGMRGRSAKNIDHIDTVRGRIHELLGTDETVVDEEDEE